MTRSARALGFLVFALLLLAGGAVWWLQGERAKLPPGTPRSKDETSTSAGPAPATATPTAAERAQLAAAPREASSDDPPDSYVKALGAFTGRLLEPDRVPVKELRVSAVAIEPSRFLLEADVLLDEEFVPPPVESASAMTDDDGRFLLERLEPRAAHLLGIDLGGPRSTFRVIDRSPITGEVVDLGDIVLEPFVTFVGRVIDEEDRPVAGARVRATNLPATILQIGLEFGVGDIRRGCGVMAEVVDSPKAFEVPTIVWQYEKLIPIPTTVTDAEGKFRLPGVPIGTITVVADKAGFKAASKVSASGKRGERDVRDLMLTEGFALHGVVVNGSGEVVPGVEVLAGIRSAALPVPAALLHPAGRSDGKGEFHLSGLPPGSEAYVATRASRGQPWNVHGPFKTDVAVLQVQLSPPSGLLVRLRDEAGQPIDDAELFIAPDPIEGGALLPPILAPPMQKLSEVTAVEIGLKRVSGLDLGKYRLIGRAANFALAQATVEVTEPPGEFELQFQAANVVKVHVVRKSDEQPLEWAFATICPEGMFERPVARGRTDDAGLVALKRVPAGKYVLTVHHPSQATQELKVEVPTPTIEVVMPLGGNLKGRAHHRGNDPGKSLIVILVMEGKERPDAAMPTLTATADTGHFAVANLEVGTYHYEVRDRIVGKGMLALFETMRDDPLAKGTLEIKEGETTEIDVDVSGTGGAVAQLAGTVWVNGTPMQDLSVRVEGPRRITVKTDERGGYFFEAIPEGTSTLTVEGMKSESSFFAFASVLHREEIELRGGETRRRDFQLEVGAVRGRVTGPGPLPAGIGTAVVLRGADESGVAQFAAPNPLTGSYEFAHVPRGKYALVVSKRGAAPSSTSIEVDPTHGDVEVNVELIASIAAKGRIVLPKDQAPPDDSDGGGMRAARYLWLVNAEKQPSGRGRIDWETLEFSIEDCAAGEYEAQLFLGEKGLVARHVVIPAAGASDLVLVFELPAEGEVLEPPFGRGNRGGGPRVEVRRN